MKKIAALVGSAALLFSMTGGVFATVLPWFPPFPMSEDEATVKNYARVKNVVDTNSNTGFNSISGGFVWGGTIYTGPAGALSDVSNVVNANSLGCGCYDDLYIKNKARVRNYVTTDANSGFNSVSGGFVKGGVIGTGAAGAESWVSNVVNTNMVGGSLTP